MKSTVYRLIAKFLISEGLIFAAGILAARSAEGWDSIAIGMATFIGMVAFGILYIIGATVLLALLARKRWAMSEGTALSTAEIEFRRKRLFENGYHFGTFCLLVLLTLRTSATIQTIYFPLRYLSPNVEFFSTGNLLLLLGGFVVLAGSYLFGRWHWGLDLKKAIIVILVGVVVGLILYWINSYDAIYKPTRIIGPLALWVVTPGMLYFLLRPEFDALRIPGHTT